MAIATKVILNINNKVCKEFLKKSSLSIYYKDYIDIFFKEASYSLPDHYKELDYLINFIANIKLSYL